MKWIKAIVSYGAGVMSGLLLAFGLEVFRERGGGFGGEWCILILLATLLLVGGWIRETFVEGARDEEV